MNTNERAPIIDGVNGKIAVLERRMEHLKRRLERDEYGSSASADFDRAESNALRSAIKAMRYHSALVDPRTDPVLALQMLHSAADEVARTYGGHIERFHDGIAHAERVLREVSP